MARPAPYSYSDAGYNGFFRRTLISNPNNNVLGDTRSSGGNRNLNFDDMQTSGALGDKLKVGRVVLNGKEGRIEIEDEQGKTVGLIGNIGD